MAKGEGSSKPFFKSPKPFFKSPPKKPKVSSVKRHQFLEYVAFEMEGVAIKCDTSKLHIQASQATNSVKMRKMG